MSIESEQDLEGLKPAGQVVARTLARVSKAVRPGVTTAALDEIACFARHGARSAPFLTYGFPDTSASA